MNKYEQNEQIHFINWLRNSHPHIITIISPIVKYGGTPQQRLRQGYIQKLMGYEKGSLDVFLPIARGKYHGIFIEFKYGKGKTSPEQDKMIFMLLANGYCVRVCYSSDEAIKLTEEYLKG